MSKKLSRSQRKDLRQKAERARQVGRPEPVVPKAPATASRESHPERDDVVEASSAPATKREAPAAKKDAPAAKRDARDADEA
ncbi:MAG TPA: hypothetical protein VLS89_00630, partial [Candidatus Nanopelagicales bacterium]|nr:hypothetical protein [Candidatus Nanopelagicales bacterium]